MPAIASAKLNPNTPHCPLGSCFFVLYSSMCGLEVPSRRLGWLCGMNHCQFLARHHWQHGSAGGHGKLLGICTLGNSGAYGTKRTCLVEAFVYDHRLFAFYILASSSSTALLTIAIPRSEMSRMSECPVYLLAGHSNDGLQYFFFAFNCICMALCNLVSGSICSTQQPPTIRPAYTILLGSRGSQGWPGCCFPLISPTLPMETTVRSTLDEALCI